jgi:tRNA(Ile)-lysidine synthase
VAFSGGGDSLALLLAAKAWTDDAGRRLVAFTVDHRLQPASADWAAWCHSRAERLGVAHRTMIWDGPKPRTGLATAARIARHGLVAEGARAAGASVVLMGHTADDRMEAAAMRSEGISVSAPRRFAPSPVWPAGREIFLLRPLLKVRRAALREALRLAGEDWIDDPANIDMRQPRARARAGLAEDQAAIPDPAAPDIRALFEALRFGLAGNIEIDAEAVARSSPNATRAFLGAAVLCVGGGARPPRGERLERLTSLIDEGEAFAATLAGARLSLTDGRLRIEREAKDRRSGAALELDLPKDRAVVWDGRFEIVARRSGLNVRPLAGLASRLDREGRASLRALAPRARPGLPAVIDEAGKVICPVLNPNPEIEVRRLVDARLAGACGMIMREASIRRVAKTDAAS